MGEEKQGKVPVPPKVRAFGAGLLCWFALMGAYGGAKADNMLAFVAGLVIALVLAWVAWQNWNETD